jgi:hypothetical protein
MDGSSRTSCALTAETATGVSISAACTSVAENKVKQPKIRLNARFELIIIVIMFSPSTK